MLTKKHYKAIAKIVKSRYTSYDPYDPEEDNMAYGIENLMWSLADYFAKDNPQFDKNKFLTACGLDS